MIAKKTFWILGTAFVLLIIFLPGYSKIQELKVKNRDLLNKNKKLSEENILLDQEIKRIRNDRFYEEKILREKMGVVRKNEIPVKIITGDD